MHFIFQDSQMNKKLKRTAFIWNRNVLTLCMTLLSLFISLMYPGWIKHTFLQTNSFIPCVMNCGVFFLSRELSPHLAAAASGSRLQRYMGSLSVAPGAHESVQTRQRPHRPAGPARGAALHRGTSADPSTLSHSLIILSCIDDKCVCVCVFSRCVDTTRQLSAPVLSSECL